MTATSIVDVLAEAEDVTHRRVTSCRILLAQELHRRHAELEAALEAAIESDRDRNEPDEAPRLRDEIEALEAEIDERKREFRFRALSRRAWQDLLKEHAPTRKQLDEAARQAGGKRSVQLDHNPETFPAALIAACAYDPEMTVEDAHRLEGALSFVQFEILYAAALECNTGGMSDPKSLVAGLIPRRNEQSATMSVPEESDAASS